MEKILSELYDEYKARHNGHPKHGIAHYMTIRSKITFHKTYIRPKIIWNNN